MNFKSFASDIKSIIRFVPSSELLFIYEPLRKYFTDNGFEYIASGCDSDVWGNSYYVIKTPRCSFRNLQLHRKRKLPQSVRKYALLPEYYSTKTVFQKRVHVPNCYRDRKHLLRKLDKLTGISVNVLGDIYDIHEHNIGTLNDSIVVFDWMWEE
jgi:hypothetical protein